MKTAYCTKRSVWEYITLLFLFLTVGGMWLTWILLSIAIPPLIQEKRITATQGGYLQGIGSGIPNNVSYRNVPRWKID
jgi:hypothetical protein